MVFLLTPMDQVKRLDEVLPLSRVREALAIGTNSELLVAELLDGVNSSGSDYAGAS